MPTNDLMFYLLMICFYLLLPGQKKYVLNNILGIEFGIDLMLNTFNQWTKIVVTWNQNLDCCCNVAAVFV